MPLHSYKTFAGLAPDRVNATLDGDVDASDVSLPLTNVVGTPGATYSAIIIDGPLTEIVACSSAVTDDAITVAALSNAHSAGTYIAFQLTAGTGPTAYMPLTKFDPTDTYAQLMDESYRGSAVKTVGAVQGLRSGAFDLEGSVFPDTFGYVLGGAFGAEDFTSGSPNTHAFSVLNTGSFQPLSFLLYDYDAFNTRIYSGKFTEVGLTLDPAQLMKFTTKFLSRASGVVDDPTPSFTSLTPVPAWTGGVTLADTVLYKVQSFSVTFTRSESEGIPSLDGTQDPYAIWVGPVAATGKFVAVKEDDSLFNMLTGETQPTLLISSTQGTTSGLDVQISECNFNAVKTNQTGKAYVTEEVDFEAIANTDDATTAGGGLSPGQVVLSNAIATGTYT